MLLGTCKIPSYWKFWLFNLLMIAASRQKKKKLLGPFLPTARAQQKTTIWFWSGSKTDRFELVPNGSEQSYSLSGAHGSLWKWSSLFPLLFTCSITWHQRLRHPSACLLSNNIFCDGSIFASTFCIGCKLGKFLRLSYSRYYVWGTTPIIIVIFLKCWSPFLFFVKLSCHIIRCLWHLQIF